MAKDIGMFINVSYTDALYYRCIISCLSPVALINDVPDNVTHETIQALINDQVDIEPYTFGYGYKEHQLLDRENWVHDYHTRFDIRVSFNSLIKFVKEDSCYAA